MNWPARAAALMAAALGTETAAMQKVLEAHVRAHLDELAEVRWGSGLRPDPDLTVLEWADRHRTIERQIAGASARPIAGFAGFSRGDR